MCLQEYRARKRQRLKKKLTEQLTSSLRQGSASASAALGAASDLQTILNSFTGERERERESNEGYVTVCLFLHHQISCRRVSRALGVGSSMRRNYSLPRFVRSHHHDIHP